jgi:hypothetical protein
VTRVIFWKEMREQSQSAFTLIVLGVIVMAVFSAFAAYDDEGRTVVGLAVVFAWASGLVAGAQLLAGDQENGTQPWLDVLPAARRQLYWRKANAGITLAIGQAAVLWLALLLRYLFFGGKISSNIVPDYFAFTFVMMCVVAVCGCAGGLFGSAFAKTTLGAIGWGLLAQVTLLSAAILLTVMLEQLVTGIVLCLAFSASAVLPAARRYMKPDRLRHQSMRVLTHAGPAARRAVLWLAWRQGRGVFVVLLLAGLALAVIVPVTTPFAWPMAGALFGVVAGLMAFGPDQNGSAYRMFGDRRFPLGGIWRTKVLLPIAVVGVAIGLLALNLLARYVVDAMNSANARDAVHRDFIWLRSGLNLATLVLGPLYGFACGQFFGLVYRKTAVAAVLALVTSLAAVLFWLPSIALGGLHAWQWLAPPIMLLVASRAAMRPWVTGRIGNLRPVAGLVVACLLAAAALAGGVAYRAIELPGPAAPFDPEASVRKLTPTGDHRVRQAIAEFAAHLSEVEAKLGPPMGDAPPLPGAVGGQAPPAVGFPPRGAPGTGVPGGGDVGPAGLVADPQEPPKDWNTSAIEAIENGWPERDEVLRRWLDELARGEWWETLKSAVGRRVGAPPDPHGFDVAAVESARRMGLMLAARSLQLQKRGDYDAALEPLELALTLTANLQLFANGHQLSVALIVQSEALSVLGDWANGVGARPSLLRRALSAVQANDCGRTPLTTAVDVEFVRALRPYDGMKNDFERTLVQFATAVPWEADRDRRFFEAVREGYMRYAALDFRTAAAAFGSRPGQNDANLGQAVLWRWVGPSGTIAQTDETGRSLVEYINRSPWLNDAPIVYVPELSVWYYVQTQLQGSILRLALMLYQCDHGRLPDSLDALVPDYLKTLPADPYTGEPFHYRVSTGERLLMFPRLDESKAYRGVPPGTAVVWSVGPDLKDGGGRVRDPNSGYRAMVADGDLLFIVPRVSKP